MALSQLLIPFGEPKNSIPFMRDCLKGNKASINYFETWHNILPQTLSALSPDLLSHLIAIDLDIGLKSSKATIDAFEQTLKLILQILKNEFNLKNQEDIKIVLNAALLNFSQMNYSIMNIVDIPKNNKDLRELRRIIENVADITNEEAKNIYIRGKILSNIMHCMPPEIKTRLKREVLAYYTDGLLVNKYPALALQGLKEDLISLQGIGNPVLVLRRIIFLCGNLKSNSIPIFSMNRDTIKNEITAFCNMAANIFDQAELCDFIKNYKPATSGFITFHSFLLDQIEALLQISFSQHNRRYTY